MVFQIHVAVADELVYVVSYDVSLDQVLSVVLDGRPTIPCPFIASGYEKDSLGAALIVRIVPPESLEGLLCKLIVPIQKVSFADEKTGLSGFLRSFVR